MNGITTGLLMLIVVVIGLLIYFRKQLQQLEDTLKEVNQELENRIQERTQALEKINQKLQNEIKERSEIEAILRYNEAKNRASIQAIPDLLFQVDKRGIYLDFQGSKTDDLLIPVDDFIGKSVTEVMPPEIAGISLHLIQESLENKTVSVWEYHLPYGDKVKYFEARFAPINEDEVLVIVRNITEQKEIQEQLYRTQQRLQYLLSNTPAVIYSCDIDTPYQLNFLSDNIKNIVGYTADDFENQPELGRINIHPEDRGKISTFIDQASQEGVARVEYRFKHKDGHYIWLYDELKRVYNPNTDVQEFVGYLVDITQRKQAKEDLFKLNKELENRVLERTLELSKTFKILSDRTALLEATNQELDAFSYSVSHDLRAPLRHINGFVNILKQKLSQTYNLRDEQVSHYLQVIENSSQKMGELIDGLLTLSKVGRQDLVLRKISLNSLVETAINLVIPPEQIHSKVQFKIGELPQVEADAILLQQVFVNLIDNAIKFSQDSSPIIIEIGTTPEGVIFVKDNGIGFNRKYANKLFNAFQQLHSKDQFPGTGIGLSIVKRIITRHKGHIWAESEPNRGTTFYFTLH